MAEFWSQAMWGIQSEKSKDFLQFDYTLFPKAEVWSDSKAHKVVNYKSFSILTSYFLRRRIGARHIKRWTVRFLHLATSYILRLRIGARHIKWHKIFSNLTTSYFLRCRIGARHVKWLIRGSSPFWLHHILIPKAEDWSETHKVTNCMIFSILTTSYFLRRRIGARPTKWSSARLPPLPSSPKTMHNWRPSSRRSQSPLL